MAEKTKVATIGQIPEGGALQVNAGGRPIAVFKQSGKVHAIDSTCLHRGGPLAEGFVEGNTVTCPWHGWRFDITTGACLMNPAAKLNCYEAVVEGEDVFINI